MLSALWTLRELSIALRHILTSCWWSLFHFSTTSTARVISRGAAALCCCKLRLPSSGLSHPLHKEFSHFPQVLLHTMEDPLHFLDALPQDYILGFASLSDELHIIFHLSSQIRLIEFYA